MPDPGTITSYSREVLLLLLPRSNYTVWTRKPTHRVAVTTPRSGKERDVVERLKQKALASAPRSVPSEAFRQLTEARFAPASLPPWMPIAREILPGPRNTLWVQQYEADPDAASTWLVLDTRGGGAGRSRRFAIRSAFASRACWPTGSPACTPMKMESRASGSIRS